MSTEENLQGSSNQARPDWMRWSEEGSLTSENFAQEVEYYRQKRLEKEAQDNWLQHLDEMTDEEITERLNQEPGRERLDEERRASPDITDRTRAEFLRDF